MGVIAGKNGPELAVIVKNASTDQLTQMRKMGMSVGKDETAGTVPKSVLKDLLGQLFNQSIKPVKHLKNDAKQTPLSLVG